jgi:hypothetical protein
MLRSGVEAAKVMKICGWKELKTMQHYIRLAGIEVQGVTERIKGFPGDLQKSEDARGWRKPAPLFFRKMAEEGDSNGQAGPVHMGFMASTENETRGSR